MSGNTVSDCDYRVVIICRGDNSDAGSSDLSQQVAVRVNNCSGLLYDLANCDRGDSGGISSATTTTTTTTNTVGAKDILSQAVKVTLPAEYSVRAVNNYISFLMGSGQYQSSDNELLKDSFVLYHYLHDNNYFEYLIDRLLYNWPCYWLLELHQDLQREIWLRVPYQLLPEQFACDSYFMKLWYSNNCNRGITVNGSDTYRFDMKSGGSQQVNTATADINHALNSVEGEDDTDIEIDDFLIDVDDNDDDDDVTEIEDADNDTTGLTLEAYKLVRGYRTGLSETTTLQPITPLLGTSNDVLGGTSNDVLGGTAVASEEATDDTSNEARVHVGGTVSDYYRITSHCTYLDGKPHGRQVYYHNNGKVGMLINSDHDTFHGPVMTFFYDGSIDTVGNYNHHKKHGQFCWYHVNGKTKKIAEYQNDVLHGLYAECNNTGQPVWIGYYNGGKKTGIWQSYYVNGVLEEELSYYKDQLHGDYKGWYESGAIKITGCHYFGKRHGLYTKYHDISPSQSHDDDDSNGSSSSGGDSSNDQHQHHRKGVIKSQGQHVNNRRDGLWNFYNERGQVVSSANYMGGQYHGIHRKFIEDANHNMVLQTEDHYQSGELHGPHFHYNHNKGRYIVGQTVDGYKTGLWITYDHLTHSIIKVNSYQDGVRLSSSVAATVSNSIDTVTNNDVIDNDAVINNNVNPTN